MAILFKGNHPEQQCPTTLPPPSTTCGDPLPCVPDEKCCSPIVPIRDYIKVGVSETERCFKLTAGGCGAAKTGNAGCIDIRLRKRGCCTELSSEKPYKITQDCSVCFKWSAAFLALGAGYYEADVYVKGVKCVSIGFYKQACSLNFETTSVFPNTTCAEQTDCCSLPVDAPELPPPTVPDCTGCTDC